MSDVSWLRRVLGGSASGLIFGSLTYGVWQYFGWLAEDPRTQVLVAVVVGVISAVGAALAGVIGDVWAHWRPRISGVIIETTERLWDRPRHRYLERLRVDAQKLVLKGVRVQNPFDIGLHKIFVDLKLDPRSPKKVAGDLLDSSQPKLSSGNHSIWRFLEREHNLVILGRPGAGKSTLLCHIVLMLTQRRAAITRPQRQRLPVLIKLREHTEYLQANPGASLAEIALRTVNNESPEIPISWMEGQLRSGRGLVLLDGLDEVAFVEERLSVAQWVERQMSVYRKCRFILTSRPAGYRATPLAGVDVLQVCAFTSEQIENFIDGWYLAHAMHNSKGSKKALQAQAEREADDLFYRIHGSPDLPELASNPMLLTMMALIHSHQGTLPDTRNALYDEICAHFLGGRDAAKRITRILKPQQSRGLLEFLAFLMMSRGQRELPGTELTQLLQEPLAWYSAELQPSLFLKEMEANSGLLREVESGSYGFTHKAIQEYLAAQYINGNSKRESLVLGNLRDPYWREVVLTVAELGDASFLMEALLDGAETSVEDLALAEQISRRALSLNPAHRDALAEILNKAAASEDPSRRAFAFEVQLRRRLAESLTLRPGVKVDCRLITIREYLLFLSVSEGGEAGLPDHWLSSEPSPSDLDKPILGLRRSDVEAFLAWTNATFDEGAPYRLLNEEDWEYAWKLPIQGLGDEDGEGFFTDFGMIGPPASNRVCRPDKNALEAWYSRDHSAGIVETFKEIYPPAFFAEHEIDPRPTIIPAALTPTFLGQRGAALSVQARSSMVGDAALALLSGFFFVIPAVLAFLALWYAPDVLLWPMKVIVPLRYQQLTHRWHTRLSRLPSSFMSRALIRSEASVLEVTRGFKRSSSGSDESSDAPLPSNLEGERSRRHLLHSFVELISLLGLRIFFSDIKHPYYELSLDCLKQIVELGEKLDQPVPCVTLLYERSLQSAEGDVNDTVLTLRFTTWLARLEVLALARSMLAEVIMNTLYAEAERPSKSPQAERSNLNHPFRPGTLQLFEKFTKLPTDGFDEQTPGEALMTAWITLQLFEERLSGAFPAYEGILIAKEYPTPKPRHH